MSILVIQYVINSFLIGTQQLKHQGFNPKVQKENMTVEVKDVCDHKKGDIFVFWVKIKQDTNASNLLREESRYFVDHPVWDILISV
mgnify:CR=1 FL=1